MAGNCSQSTCTPEETGCNVEGFPNVKSCPHYKKDQQGAKEEVTQPEEDSYRVSWTGNTLGLTDLNFLSATLTPITIGIAGIASAGKTTFLASLYCLLRQGKQIGDYHFAGSLTLTGWENIAWYLSWKSNGNIEFPPHTSNNAGRVPGLLHLALKNASDEKLDLIFTDAPGEWFDYWRNNKNDANAKGAKWIHDNANAFLLFADCDMLAGEKKGQAKQQIKSVSDRIYENLQDRPFGLIWSKSDVSITQETKNQIISHLKRNPMIHYREFETSVKEGPDGLYHQNICESIYWVIESLNSNVNSVPLIASMKPEDLFLSKR